MRCPRFSVTRQLRYSQDAGQLALDVGLFINGLPVATFEFREAQQLERLDDREQVVDLHHQVRGDDGQVRAAVVWRGRHGLDQT